MQYVVASIDRINEMANFASSKEIGFIGINSNDASVYSSDSFENMQKRAEKGMPYPYLFDETQIVAETFDAKRTPEFFLFDGDGRLVYKGRMDDSPRNPNQVSRTELLDAISSLLEGRTIENKVTESIGCSVKWKQ
jgi:peroxiredoxin